MDELLKPENRPKLADILTYPVVPGKVMVADVVKLTEAETLLGTSLQVEADGHMTKIHDAQVILTDIFYSNGVIHVIDTVLLPPQ